jgi:threonine dehydratase
MVDVTADLMRSSHSRIPAAFRNMPQFVSEPLSELIGASVVIKAETANPIGCFKGRGTWLALADLAERGGVGEGSGVIVASAGNFGQGVAYACRALGVPAVVVAATTANPAKVDAMRRLGADVILVGEDFDMARTAAADLALETGQRLLIDGQDPWIAIGAGTIALEITDAIERDEIPALSALYVPVGNGSLIAGIGTWLRQAAPHTRVVGVQAARAPAMTLSWAARRAIETERADTVADGIAARVPVAEALELMLSVVDEMVLVEETAILDATAELSAAVPFSVEPAAGAGWAAIRQKTRSDGAIGLILTGGNVAP